jgi:hypothetical protein
MAMDVIDYEIRGSEMQFVEVELDPGEAAIGEAGSMMFMDAGITMDTVFGDGSAQQGGLFGKLIGAGKRLVTGESLFTTVYSNQAATRQRVAFAAPYPGKILPMDLRQLGGTLVCQKDAFLCAARGVSLGIALQQKLSAGFFGGEGFIMQRLEGDGLPSCMPAARWCGANCAPARRCWSTPAAWWPTPQVSPSTSSSWARSRPRSSAGKACSSHAWPVRAPCGCRACRSRGWPRACSRPRRSVAAAGKKARSSAAWRPAVCSAACSAATATEPTPLAASVRLGCGSAAVARPVVPQEGSGIRVGRTGTHGGSRWRRRAAAQQRGGNGKDEDVDVAHGSAPSVAP